MEKEKVVGQSHRIEFQGPHRQNGWSVAFLYFVCPEALINKVCRDISITGTCH